MGTFTDGGVGWRPAEARRCDHCASTAAVVFCGAHNAFLCVPCDVTCHELVLRHQRSWICDACEQNPAAFTCKADAAALCFACDRDIHAANPLARRHHRAPVAPFYNTAESLILRAATADRMMMGAAPPPDGFMMGNNVPTIAEITDAKSSSLDHLSMFSDIDDDQLFEFNGALEDSIVPVQTSPFSTITIQTNDHLNNQFEMYDDLLKTASSYCSSFSTTTPSLSVSSSLDTGIVPEGSMMSSDMSNPKPSNVGIMCISESLNQQAHATAKEVREAKVMRYREKRKNRKFKKTIRYASRKAYAESRPRIKGRFAKRSTDDQSDLDFDFDGHFGAIAASFIVPSF